MRTVILPQLRHIRILEFTKFFFPRIIEFRLNNFSLLQSSTLIIFLPQCGHVMFTIFSTKVIGMSQFIQFQVGIAISKLNEGDQSQQTAYQNKIDIVVPLILVLKVPDLVCRY